MKIYLLLLVVWIVPVSVFAEQAPSNISPYEKQYLKTETLIKSLLNKDVILYGMILNSDEVNMNLKVFEFSKLSEFMEALEKHDYFVEPKLIAHSEFHLPGFVLINVKVRNK